MYLGDLNGQKYTKQDKYLLGVLLVGGKKALTRKWLKKDKPTINEWIDIIYNIYVMERITFRLRQQIDIFEENWSKWLSYVSSLRPDFV